jgi:hypothetical protein
MLLIAQPVQGCRNIGSSLHCDLPPPTSPSPVATAIVPPRKTPIVHRPFPGKRRYVRRTRREIVLSPNAAPPSGEIAAHIESLVSIGDCTGARTYALSIEAKPLADAAYAGCVGGSITLGAGAGK